MTRARGVGAWLAALTVGGILVVLGVAAWALAQPAARVVATTGVLPARYVIELDAGARTCQAIGVVRGSADGLQLSVSVRSGGAPLLLVSVDGQPAARTGETPTGIVDLSLEREVGSGPHTVCVRNLGRRPLLIAGEGADVLPAAGVEPKPGSFKLWLVLEDRTPPTWSSVVPDAVSRVGAAPGSPLGAVTGWLVLALVAVGLVFSLLAVSAAALAGRAGEARGRPTRAALGLGVGRGALITVAVVAGACGSAWALLTPPFQVPDEPGHYAYVQYIAETGRLPGASADQLAYADEQTSAMAAVGHDTLVGRADNRVPGSNAENERALRDASGLPRENGGGRTGASAQPPLFYGVAALPYYAASWATVPTRLLVLRLFSVLMLAATAVLAGLLARELLPSHAWAPVIAGLVVALQPVIGFISAGATPEALMDLIAVAFLLASVRAIRRPSIRAAALVGILAGAGAVTKITLVAFVPAAALVIALVAVRLARGGTPGRGVRAAALGAAALGVLPVLYVAWTTAVGRGLFPPGAAAGVLPADAIPAASAREFLSYVWQLYLPRIPVQVDVFGYSALEETWAFGWLGRYGWLDYGIDGWVRDLGLYVICLLGVSAIVGLLRHRAAVWAARWELATFVVATASLALVIAVGGYQYKRSTALPFEQARYLFPLVGLYGLVAVTAVLGPGRRARIPMLWVLVVLLCIHQLSGIFLTLTRYYG